MSKTEATRLVRYQDFVDSWRKAARHAECGRPVRAEALMRRTLRSARALQRAGHSLQRAPHARSAMDRLTAPIGLRMGPALTPSINPMRKATAPGLTIRTSAVKMRVGRKSVDGLTHSTSFQLLVDVSRQRVFVDGKDLPLEGRDTPLNILAALIRHGGGPMTLEEMFPVVWGRALNPAYDSNTVYFHISRLRKFLEQLAPGMNILSTTAEGYALAPGLRYALIEAEKPRQAVGRNKSKMLELLADRKFVDNRSYCDITGVSRSTALRELADLVSAGVLVREGAGRGVRYRVASTDAAQLVVALEQLALTRSASAMAPMVEEEAIAA